MYNAQHNYHMGVIYKIKARIGNSEFPCGKKDFVWETYLHRIRHGEVTAPAHEIKPNLFHEECSQIRSHLTKLIKEKDENFILLDLQIFRDTTISYEDSNGFRWTGYQREVLAQWYEEEKAQNLIFSNKQLGYLPTITYHRPENQS